MNRSHWLVDLMIRERKWNINKGGWEYDNVLVPNNHSNGYLIFHRWIQCIPVDIRTQMTLCH